MPNVEGAAAELSRSLERRAKELLGVPSMTDALTRSVCMVQRADGALRLNAHLIMLALDGVYTEDADALDRTRLSENGRLHC